MIAEVTATQKDALNTYLLEVVPVLNKLAPEPCGYHLVVAPIPTAEETDGGIVIPEERRLLEDSATVVAYVVRIGSSAYMDEKRFPKGAWCKEGDFILMRPYTGTRFNNRGFEFRIINDDTPEAVLKDPIGVKRHE